MSCVGPGATHHHACDCREQRFAEVERQRDEARAAADKSCGEAWEAQKGRAVWRKAAEDAEAAYERMRSEMRDWAALAQRESARTSEATDIARAAMAEGLAECDRLRCHIARLERLAEAAVDGEPRARAPEESLMDYMAGRS